MKSFVTTLFEHRSQQKPFNKSLDLRYQCTKKREIINYDRTIGTNRIKLFFKNVATNAASTLRNVKQLQIWLSYDNALQMKVEAVNFRKSQEI